MTLDGGGRSAHRNRFDHVRIQRPLDQEFHFAEPARFLFENADELLADNLALLLGIDHVLEPLQESGGGVDGANAQVSLLAECVRDLLELVQAQQAVVDEDASEPVAERTAHQCSRHRRVDAAGERA